MQAKTKKNLLTFVLATSILALPSLALAKDPSWSAQRTASIRVELQRSLTGQGFAVPLKQIRFRSTVDQGISLRGLSNGEPRQVRFTVGLEKNRPALVGRASTLTSYSKPVTTTVTNLRFAPAGLNM